MFPYCPVVRMRAISPSTTSFRLLFGRQRDVVSCWRSTSSAVPKTRARGGFHLFRFFKPRHRHWQFLFLFFSMVFVGCLTEFHLFLPAWVLEFFIFFANFFVSLPIDDRRKGRRAKSEADWLAAAAASAVSAATPDDRWTRRVR